MYKLCFYLLFIIFIGCSNAPDICEKCNGTGKLSESYEDRLKFEINNTEWIDDSGLFQKSYEYIYKAKVTNMDTETGEFTLVVKWTYPGIGDHETKSSQIIQPGQSKVITAKYNTESKVKEVYYHVESPIIIRTNEKICFKCNGRGMN